MSRIVFPDRTRPPIDKIEDLKAQNDWRATHKTCYLCGWTYDGRFKWIELHHIIQGTGRSDEPTNFAAVCNGENGCHDKIHAGKITRREVILAKFRLDPQEFDYERLRTLYGKELPVSKEELSEGTKVSKTPRGVYPTLDELVAKSEDDGVPYKISIDGKDDFLYINAKGASQALAAYAVHAGIKVRPVNAVEVYRLARKVG